MKNLFTTSLDYEQLINQYGSPLLVLDTATVRFQYRELKRALPGVTLHYALKPLPHPDMIATLKAEGASFDLASNGEVDLVREQSVDPSTCIHTHPIKKQKDIEYALEYGNKIFVFDNETELFKFETFKEEANLLLRVSFPNPETKVDLSKKFGCMPENVLSLLRLAHKNGYKVVGLSFHVGSQVASSKRHVEAINACLDLISQAAQEGINLEILDIGGGFPVDYKNAEAVDIYSFCEPIRNALAKAPSYLRLLAEPGRFLSAPAMVNICSVVGIAERFGKPWYYLDDGVYCSYSGQIFDHVVYPKYSLSQLSPVVDSEIEEVPSVLAGPTCDSIDVIAEDQSLPRLKVGDLLVGKMMGAYTIATATEFNFVRKTQILTVDLEHESSCELEVVKVA